jgi:hypothetical protein
MPVHDWTLVDAGIFHNFHLSWISEICKALNGGLLPEGYYAMAEQHAGRSIPDVLTLHESSGESGSMSSTDGSGGTAVAEAPPQTRRHRTIEQGQLGRRRTVAVRHVSGHRLIAMVDILSRGNKDGPKHIEEFADKAFAALKAGIHLLLIDLFPPGRYDRHGIHDVIRQLLEDSDEPYDLPHDEPLTLASYVADQPIEIYLEHLATGASLAEMPLFLNPDRYVNVPLESTYAAAYQGMPKFWRNVLEGRQSQA